ncbi:MAG: beta-galactosidase small subunit [Lachnospiraceae bacterium]|jgi:beta-galactosidase|nr:beta-galactosidase small subunit [Lachnospiraceae bacterium]
MDYTDKQQSENLKNGDGKLGVVFGDVVLGVHGEGFEYLFSYAAGGMVSLVTKGREWLYRAPMPTFWRATTDNDRGSKFSFHSSMWLGADLFLKTERIKVWLDGEDMDPFLAPDNNRFGGEQEARELRVAFSYTAATVPKAQVEVSYTVKQDGKIQVDVHYCGKKGLPELPVFGMRFIMPTKADGFRYFGLSGETYPDRMAGGIKGEWEIEGLPVTPYLVPQDCGVHMDTDWLEIQRSSVLANERRALGQREKDKRFSLGFEKVDVPFSFSCLPYTAEELENATHQEELPPARRTVVCILGAVRGVGGIDSWGSDVEEPWHIDGEKDIRFSFAIVPVWDQD